MLTAYFDDSGTHAGANITLLAGIFGNQYQWDHFNTLWRKTLDEPLSGTKPRLLRFHMTDCFNSLNEFSGWKRTETDFFAHELSNIIFRCGLWGCATSVTGRAWDEHVTGELRRAAGDAEGGAIRNCFHLTLDWARNFARHEREVAFVFENRPERKKEYEAIYSVFSDYARETDTPPQLVSLTFANGFKSLPIQAADLFAWEVYQDELHFLGRDRPKGEFHRKLLTRMAASGRFRMQSGTPDAIGKMVESLKDDLVKHPKVMDDLDKYFRKA
jgi:hypothetical protein